MFRIIRFLICLLGTFGAAMALAQTPTPLPVQGNLSSIIGSGQQYAGVSIQLQNCASPVSITGYSVIVQQGYQVMANGSGLVNTTVWPNDLITCNGTTGNSQYQLSYTANGAVQGTPQCYQVVSTQETWNLNAQQPIACAQTPPNPADEQYRNLNLTGFLSGVNGAMSGTWQAASFIATGMAANSGKCAQWGSGGSLGAASFACGGTTNTITALTGDVSAAGPGSVPATLATVNSGPGACGDSTHVCQVTTDGKGRTLAQTPVAISGGGGGGGGTPYGGAPGIQFNVNSTTGRLATSADIETALGYTPLNPSNNLSDVQYQKVSLKNLFAGSGLASSPLIGVDGSGNPIFVALGKGLQINTSGSGYSQSVTGLILTNSDWATGTLCWGVMIGFSGGGGTGAAASPICSYNPGGIGHAPGYLVTGYLMTNVGSGYSSAPTVTVTGAGATTFTAVLGTSENISTTWQSGTFYSVTGTPLPACSSTTLLQRLAVSDATSGTPGTTYAGSGSYTIPVQCIFNATGSVYTWIID